MSNNLKYSIEKIIYKNTDLDCYFLISGYCYAKDNSSIVYHTKVNGEDALFGYTEVYRKDVFDKDKVDAKKAFVGFLIRVDICDEDPKSFQLTADNNGQTTVLVSLTEKEIQEYEDKHSIEFDIDSAILENEISMITVAGWAYSNDCQQVQISIYDDQNNLVESSCRYETRMDLLRSGEITEEQKFCGFRISFKCEKNKQYYVELKTSKETRVEKLELTRTSGSTMIKRFARHINAKNIKKAITYVKRNGVSKLVHRLRYGSYIAQSDYQTWLFAQRVTKKNLQTQSKTKFAYSPKISILVATFNTKEEYLKEMIDTVVNQSYSNWELCIADGSTNDFVEKYVYEHYSSYGDKIKFKKLDQNYGISGNTNKAFEMATGDYITVYDHDDTLELDCFFEIVKALQEYRYDVLYTDEDKFDDSTKMYNDPNLKPDFSEDLLRSHNYITHLFIVNKKIVDEVGYYNSEFDGSQDYDYIFRCVEKANAVYHIPRILYHWRMHPESTAQNPENKMYCYDAGKRAIEAHYKRVGVEATVEFLPKPMYGMYHTIYSTKDNPLVSILIPNYNHKAILKTCIDSLYNVNTYKNFEIVIVENNSTEKEIFDYYEELKKQHDNIHVVTYKGQFNYSRINNFGMKYTNGDYVLLLNNDTEVISPNALSEMVGCILRPEVGAVGAKLLYEDDTVQHAGVVIGFSGYAGHVNHGINKDDYGYMVRARINCNYSAVTAACMMVKKSVFNQVGGFDEQFVVACNDVDLCLKICKEKYLIVYNAFALWHHYESKSRGYDDASQEKTWRFNKEVEKFQDKWKDVLINGDPFYNSNWNIQYGPFRLY